MSHNEHQLTEVAALYIYALVHDLDAVTDADVDADLHARINDVLTTQKAYALDATSILQLATAARVIVAAPGAKTLSAAAYDKARSQIVACMPRSGNAGVRLWPPTSQTVRAHLGGGAWNDALEAVGIPTAKTGRARGSSRFSHDDFRKAMADFSKASDNRSYKAYEEWVKAERAQGRERPAGATVRNTFGTWSEAMRLAAE